MGWGILGSIADGVKNAGEWVGDHVSEAWGSAHECFSDAGDCFKSGNILGGIGNGFAGLSTGIVGTASGGLSVAAGDAISKTGVGSKIVEALGEDKLAETEHNKDIANGWKAIQEHWAMAGDHFKNGNIIGGLYNGAVGILGNVGNALTFGNAGRWGEALANKVENGQDLSVTEKLLNRIAKGNAESELLQEDLETNGRVGYANLLGTVDLGSLALDATAGAAFANIATAPLKQVGKESLKQGVKVATKETVATGAKEGAYISGSQWAKKTALNGLLAASAAHISGAAVNDMASDAAQHGIATAAAEQARKQLIYGDEKDAPVEVDDRLISKVEKPNSRGNEFSFDENSDSSADKEVGE